MSLVTALVVASFCGMEGWIGGRALARLLLPPRLVLRVDGRHQRDDGLHGARALIQAAGAVLGAMAGAWLASLTW